MGPTLQTLHLPLVFCRYACVVTSTKCTRTIGCIKNLRSKAEAKTQGNTATLQVASAQEDNVVQHVTTQM